MFPKIGGHQLSSSRHGHDLTKSPVRDMGCTNQL